MLVTFLFYSLLILLHASTSQWRFCNRVSLTDNSPLVKGHNADYLEQNNYKRQRKRPRKQSFLWYDETNPWTKD